MRFQLLAPACGDCEELIFMSEERWRERIRELRGHYTHEEFAKKIGVSEKTVERWLRGDKATTPKPDYIKQIAESFPDNYPLDEQFRDLGWLPQGTAAPWAASSDSQSGALLLSRLWHAVDSAAPRLGVLDLAHELLRSCETDGLPGRWRVRIFDVPSGRKYPHAVFHAAEFQRAPGQPHWGKEDWERRGEDPLVWGGISPGWIKRRLGGGFRDDDFRDKFATGGGGEEGLGPVVPELVARDRLELLWRMRRILPLVSGSWVGEVGRQYHELISRQDEPAWRHIYLTLPYREAIPDPRDRASVEMSGQKTRTLLIGPGALMVDSIAGIIGEGLGYEASTARHLAERWTGQVHSYDAAARARAFPRVWHDIATANSGQNFIFAVYDLDALMLPQHDGDGLAESTKAMLTSEQVFPILLAATPGTLDEWEERQRDRRFPYDQGNLGGANTKQTVQKVMRLAHDFLSGNAKSGSWMAWAVKWDIPWSPARSRDGRTSGYLDSTIGDYLVRVAYFLASTLETSSRRSLQFSEHSLLWEFRSKLPSLSEAGFLFPALGEAGPSIIPARNSRGWCEFLENGDISTRSNL